MDVLCHGYSFQRCGLIFLFFLLSTAAVVGVATLLIVFVLQPRRPFFSIQTIRLDSIKLNTSSTSTVYASSVVSLGLRAENPNKFGIGYGPSQLLVLCNGIPVGSMQLPGFYQPAQSKNVNVETLLVFERVNVTQIVAGLPFDISSGKSIMNLRLVGDDIAVHVRAFHLTILDIKVAMDCKIIADYDKFFFNDMKTYSTEQIRDLGASLLSKNKSSSIKCSTAVVI